MFSQTLPDITVTARHLRVGGWQVPCAIGRAGVTRMKREGDGATPAGRWPLRKGFFRADRLPPPDCPGLVFEPILPRWGWCDAPDDPRYNRAVNLPYPASAERLWRGDPLYDVVLVMGYNDRPPIPGQGSAIFLHVARPNYGPTEGCVALAQPHLRSLLGRLRQGMCVSIIL